MCGKLKKEGIFIILSNRSLTPISRHPNSQPQSSMQSPTIKIANHVEIKVFFYQHLNYLFGLNFVLIRVFPNYFERQV